MSRHNGLGVDLATVSPHDHEAERAVLGAILIDPVVIDDVAAKLSAQDFSLAFSRAVFQAILDIHSRRIPIDTLTLVKELERQGQLAGLGGPTAISDLTSVVPSSANALHYADRVKTQAILHRATIAVGKAGEVLANRSLHVEERLEAAERLVFEATRAATKETPSDMGSVLTEVFAKLDKRARGELDGLSTGIHGLDSLTNGFHGGDVIVLAARPGVGKSTLALAITLNVVRPTKVTHQPKPVLFVSLEMPETEVVLNMACNLARVDTFVARSRNMSRQDHGRLMDAGEVLSPCPLHVCSPGGFSLLDLRSKARRHKAQFGLGLLVVDYLQLLVASKSSSRQNRQEEVAEISRGLKALAVELNVPVLALAQLNRGVEERVDNRPRMSDLRESGAIEADASVILLLHRQAYHKHDVPEEVKKEATLIVAKNRYGPTGDVELHYEPAFAFFGDRGRA